MKNILNSDYYDLSKKLIAINTVSSNSNSLCAELVANRLNDLGFKVHIDRHQDGVHEKQQVVAMIGPEVEDGIILSGHMDTVPFENQPGWSLNPLNLELKEDKLFGRGTCDMKIFISQCIEAFSQLNLEQLKKPIVCIFTADEEVGCLGAHRLSTKLDKILEKMPLPKRAIIGEPTSFEVINAHKGIVHFDIELTGKSGHSSRPDLGSNSISSLGKIINLVNDTNFNYQNELDSELKKIFPDFPYNYLHMATVHGGIALNMIPEKTILQISYRNFPSEPSLQVLNEFKKNLSHLNLGEQVRITNVMKTPAMPISVNEQLEKTLMEITKSNSPHSVSFATDGGYFSKLGINSFICGPGEIKMAHQPDEYLPIADFIKGPDIIKNILRNLLF